ncbi:type I-E CRISPR-associated protein Cse1/CasA [Streptomyces olivaceus]|uniref:type I-E CRISPR-associated protein Cse1/CasA n=1 Tax=Streptomyces TaxID=1883 RepID=UPI001CCA83B8|nr:MULTISPECIES: type I-E CRISPR-associated protein Cse1/CasA [Streptomyces]MBZ6199896.1 type I-E CRISPR-associated protein Cse1/CasA [Streptomyces olivaceus]MBZ6304809.1 type I-E CRISPR-associated protein Cse1/CasA [Streptomyces olivaceus]MBZ6317927.1 type I-E CRISPR-associated protein Cse1/CasA [Streptomyces olivaceus]MCC2266498.1 type I-E CRISPR-associated protein Cse1/CasA [Streptomyces sp. CT1-17]
MPETTPDSASAPGFDLTGQPWIGVLRCDGSQDELSLRQIFAQAGGLRCVVGELATQEFSLVRLLLAVAHDALDGPGDIEEWAELWEDPDCFAPVQAYLEEHRERFDLLHPVAPFLQTAGLRTAKDEVFSLNRIVADVPAGEPFFSARMPDVERLSFAEAARWVVHVHAYDTSGIKSGMVGDDRVKGGKVYPLGTGWAGGLGGVFVEGGTLRETLLLNLVATDTETLDFSPADRPAWRREPCGPGSDGRSATGLRDLYTWQSRRVRLHHGTDGVRGVVLGYGDPLASRNMHGSEPMTPWRRSPAQEKKLGRSPVFLPLEHDPARSAWRGIASLVADRLEDIGGTEGPSRLRPRVLEWVARLVTEGYLPRQSLVRTRVVGVRYGTQQSVVDEVVDDRLEMPVVLLHGQDPVYARQAVAAAEDADRAVRALGDLADDLARATGSESEGPKAAARAEGFDVLDHPYRSWLSDMAEAPDPFEHRSTWQRQVRETVGRLGDRLIVAAGDAAWEGRMHTDAKGGSHWLNAGLADVWFRGRLARALGNPDSPAASGPSDSSGASVADGTGALPGDRGPSGPELIRPASTEPATTGTETHV